jgi:hypothetical protein
MSVALPACRRPLVAIGVAFTLTACGPTASFESVGDNVSGLTANDHVAFDYFRGKGLTSIQAAGIIGNLDQESGMSPTAAQSGGPGRGIAQWSTGGRWDSSSGDNATWYAGKQGQSVWSLQLQLDFIWYELTTFSAFGLATLEQSTSVAAATGDFARDFEICGACNQSQRVAYAEAALQAYGGDTPDASPSPPPDAAPASDDAGIPCFVTSLGLSGECMPTSACGALPMHSSTPGYCPGAADIECCTGPSDDAGM